MIKLFEEFNLLDQDLEFGDIVTIRSNISNHHKGEKAIVLELLYLHWYGEFARYRIEFLDGSQRICSETLLQKRVKKTYDDTKFLNTMKKRESYLFYKNKEEKDGNFLFIKEKERKERERKEIKRKERERKREELRIKMLDVDPYGEEDWGNFDDDDEFDRRFRTWRNM